LGTDEAAVSQASVISVALQHQNRTANSYDYKLDLIFILYYIPSTMHHR